MEYASGLQENEMKKTNYLEIKKMIATITSEGVVAAFRLLPAPQVTNQDACPFARCAELEFDKDLGVLTNKGAAVHAVRLLVIIQSPGDGEVVATPDVTNSGFRVCRKVKCAMAGQNSDIYEVKVAGIATSVQRLMTASEDACFLIAAKRRGADEAFNIIAYEDTRSIGLSQYQALLNAHMEHTSDVTVAHAIADTPQKRLESLTAAVPAASTPEPFSNRKKLS